MRVPICPTSFTRWTTPVLVVVASIGSACAHAGPALSKVGPTAPIPFVVTSESTLYAIRGRFVGEIRFTASRLSVTVTQGSVLGLGDYGDVRVAALVAGATGTGWQKVAE